MVGLVRTHRRPVMDTINPFYTPYLPSQYKPKRERVRRDTISVSPSRGKFSKTELKKWHGTPPAPIPETDRSWRPTSFPF